jgi:tetratricopeptide (TPR) repeat protein
MKLESLVYGIAGIVFGLMVGWIIGAQQASGTRAPAAAPQAQAPASTPTPAGSGTGQAPPLLDETRVRTLQGAAEQRPQDAIVRIELGNLYFDAERYTDAIRWYEQALKIDPKNVNASTDLGVAYYYTNQADRALQQFDHSLSVDPRHTKTLLNAGIVRAFGKQDLEGAAKAWEQVIALAPDTPEGRAARQALDGMRSAHPEVGGGAAAGAATKGTE